MVGRMPERRVDLSGRLARKGPRKLLAIDVGGIRGVLSLKILEEIEQLLIREIKRDAPAQGTTTSVAISPDVDQLQKAINLLTTLLAASTDGKQPLGQVNGALGETIGNLLNGKKTAVGVGGALITSLLAAVTSSPSAGGLAGLFGTIASSVPGLSQFALPVFLATTAWGVLGKFEKWAQGTAPPPKPQVVSVPSVVH
jgi:hypothetical protein